jgi:dCTP deaminase
MILTGKQIEFELQQGRIEIDPFAQDLLNPNSYNFRLGDTLIVYKDGVIDPRFPADTETFCIDESGFELEPNKLYLGHTLERLGSTHFVPLIGGRSSTGRLGLFVHITAPLGDIGYIGQWTLQLRSTLRVRVYPMQKIGQIMFVHPYGPIALYSGKYQHGQGPQPYQSKDLFGEQTPDPYSQAAKHLTELAPDVVIALQNEMSECLARAFAIKRNFRMVVDVGCGTGLMLIEMEKKKEIEKIVGIDSSHESIEYCLNKCTRSTLFCEDYSRFSMKSINADLIVMFAFLHLFPIRIAEKLIKKAYDELVYDGILIASTSLHEKMSEGWEEKKTLSGAWRYRVRFNKESWFGMFSNGWEVLEYWTTEEISDQSNLKKWQYLMLKKVRPK